MVNFTKKVGELDGFGSLILPAEEVKLTETSLGRLGLLASNTLLLVTLSKYSTLTFPDLLFFSKCGSRPV